MVPIADITSWITFINISKCKRFLTVWTSFVLNVFKSFDFFIKWEDLNISADARRITNFSDAKYLKNAVDAKQVLKIFEDYIYNEDYLIVGHNILGFDVYIHGIFRQLLGKRPDYSYINRCVDTLCLAKAIKKDIDIDKSDDFIEWQYKLNSFIEKRLGCSIQALCKSYELDFDPSKLHNALYDIDVNFKIFQKQLWQLEIWVVSFQNLTVTRDRLLLE